MAIFDGLYGYEQAMLVLGVVLVICALIAFFKGQSVSRVGLLLAFAVVFMGFPAYSSIEISKDGIKLGKAVHDLQENPTSKEARQAVAEVAEELSPRPIKNVNLVTTIASAQFALGNSAQAEQTLGKALQADPKNSEALELKKRIELDKNLSRLTSQLVQNPTDEAAKMQLATAVSEASKLKIANPNTIANLARGQAALGDTAAAKENLSKVMKINPRLVSDPKL
jgi:tetratricopeptide (TPR) repeat protein